MKNIEWHESGAISTALYNGWVCCITPSSDIPGRWSLRLGREGAIMHLSCWNIETLQEAKDSAAVKIDLYT